MADLDLGERGGLPDALRILLADFPRDGWQAHPNFGGMVQFWLERHLMFRDLLDRLTTEAQTHFDGNSAFDAYAPRLSRLGGFFLQQLHGHHGIEDQHYFPQLMQLDPRLDRGFAILDSDHHELEGLLVGFADGANAVLQAQNPAAALDATGAFVDRLTGFAGFLDRHLTDEEELIVPVILKTGFSG